MSQSWTQACFCRAKLYHHENICCSCSNTFCDSQLRKVARAASNGNILWPNFSLLMGGVWIGWYFESQMHKVCVPSCPESLMGFFLSSFGDVVCGLLQSCLLYQFSVLSTSFWGLSRNLFKFRCNLFFCICFCYFCDSWHWERTHLACCTILFSLSDNVHVVWTV